MMAKEAIGVEAIKFALLADLGTFVVPNDYDHATYLCGFRERNRGKFYGYSDAVNDNNFPNPSRVLRPGDRLSVRVFRQVVDGTTSSEERLAFLANEGAVLVGAQGTALVFDEKRVELPRGYWYVSMDKGDRLWKDADGNHSVPHVRVFLRGGFGFSRRDFESPWVRVQTLLCFCDLPAA